MNFLTSAAAAAQVAAGGAGTNVQCNIFPNDTSANNTFIAIINIAVTVVRILQILVPVALIVWGTIDLAKAVIEGDEKKMKEKRKPFIQRVISAVIVFLVPWLVGLILGMVGGQEWKQCWNSGKLGNYNLNNTIKQNDPLNVQ